MATVTITADTLTVRFSTAEKVLGLVGDREFPLSSVESVNVEANGFATVRGVRAPGLGIPGRLLIGTWRGRGRTLVCVRRGQPALVVELSGQRYARLVIGAENAAELARQLQPVG
jgi:hypothetical protein